jgi:hypothetical protein
MSPRRPARSRAGNGVCDVDGWKTFEFRCPACGPMAYVNGQHRSQANARRRRASHRHRQRAAAIRKESRSTLNTCDHRYYLRTMTACRHAT